MRRHYLATLLLLAGCPGSTDDTLKDTGDSAAADGTCPGVAEADQHTVDTGSSATSTDEANSLARVEFGFTSVYLSESSTSGVTTMEVETACDAGATSVPYQDVEASGADLAACWSLAEGGEDLKLAAAEVLAAKLAAWDARNDEGSCIYACKAGYVNQVCAQAASGAAPALPPPPTGSCPDDLVGSGAYTTTDCASYTLPTNSLFTFENSGAMNTAQANLAVDLSNLCGCWIQVEPATTSVDENLMWFGVLYGMVNFGTGATLKAEFCGSSTPKTIAVSYLKLGIPTASLEPVLTALHDPNDIEVSGSPTLTVVEIAFAYLGKNYTYKKGVWSPSNPLGGSTCSKPFNLDGTGPVAILDPASEEQLNDLVSFASLGVPAVPTLSITFDDGT